MTRAVSRRNPVPLADTVMKVLWNGMPSTIFDGEAFDSADAVSFPRNRPRRVVGEVIGGGPEVKALP